VNSARSTGWAGTGQDRWRRAARAGLAAAVLVAQQAAGYRAVNSYSPRDAGRALRRSTELIVLHTTEAPKAGSLRKIRANGEAHYMIDEAGKVYRIIHKDRIALHAGRSMWNGKKNLDRVSLGIEMVGYHNRPITGAQTAALRELLAELQRIYHVPDDRVLPHSMVAYGAPNRWHKRSHRGRKRCGMLFAQRPVRRRLGLDRQPAYDPDVRAGRLVVADPYLAKVLYGTAVEQEKAAAHFAGEGANVIAPGRSAWDIARDQYASAETVYVFPGGQRRRGDEIRDWRKMPKGTRVMLAESQRDNPVESMQTVGVNGTPSDIAGAEADRATTIYFLPDGRVRRGDELSAAERADVPAGTRVLVGYSEGGAVTSRRSAFDICGERWRFPSTFYRFPDGSIVSGDAVDERKIPDHSVVFFRN